MAGEQLREPDEPRPAHEPPGGPVQSNIPYGQAVNMIMEGADTKALSWSPSDRKPADHHQSAFQGIHALSPYRWARAADLRDLADPVGQFSRRLDSGRLRRLGALFHEVQDAETVDDVVVNTGLAYLLSFAWRAFLDSDDVVEGIDLHPAVETVARILRADPDAGDLATLARAASLSSSHLSRIFKEQTGVSISWFRNQQRLQRFLRLYGTGRRTTALAAALEAGFGSYAQFYRVFRQQAGRSPSALRTAATDDDLNLGRDHR
jgi:AraC-like DNA-binding protein